MLGRSRRAPPRGRGTELSQQNLWKHSTSTVGLVTSRHGAGVNVMAAEWTYFVAKEPPHVAIGVHDDNLTQELVLEHGEFGVTLCTADQAVLADFVGSMSGRDIDKTSSELVTLVPPVVTSTPRVAGGVLSAECVVREIVKLPNYRLIVGEVVYAEVDEAASADPLVKHGAMYRIGAPIVREAVAVAAEVFVADDGRTGVLVAATGPFADGGGVVVDLVSDLPPGRWELGRPTPDEYGDVYELFEVPPGADPLDLATVRVVVTTGNGASGAARISSLRSATATPAGPS